METPVEKHKFDRPMDHPLTYRRRFQLEYVEHLIPYLKILEKEIGHDKVIETLRTLAIEEASRYAEDVRAQGMNDLSVFRKSYNPNVPGYNDILTIQVLKDTETVYEIKITECIWAQVFRDAGAAEYGLAAVCAGDVPFTRFINPNLDCELTGTCMEGKPFCILRYFVKS